MMTEHPLTDDMVIRYFGLKQIGCEHPLTDEICEEISLRGISITMPIERNNMREAADWQLEKVIEWLKDNVSHSLLLEVTDKGVTYPNTSKNDKSLLRLDLNWIVDDLKKAMRPTSTQEENN